METNAGDIILVILTAITALLLLFEFIKMLYLTGVIITYYEMRDNKSIYNDGVLVSRSYDL